jgi:frataxin-like iron-binding protein CyaY
MFTSPLGAIQEDGVNEALVQKLQYALENSGSPSSSDCDTEERVLTLDTPPLIKVFIIEPCLD